MNQEQIDRFVEEMKNYSLTDKQLSHLQSIQFEFAVRCGLKYRKGAAEHGGNLFDLSVLSLIDNAISECVDQFTYLVTLREKYVQEKNL